MDCLDRVGGGPDYELMTVNSSPFVVSIWRTMSIISYARLKLSIGSLMLVYLT